MCQFASGFLRPTEELPVRIADLNSHSDTQEKLKLKDGQRADGWREFHWTPKDEIEVRVLEGDSFSAEQCKAGLRARWPGFIEFLNWALKEPSYVDSELYLNGLTSAKGLKLPEKVDWLDLPKKVRLELEARKCKKTARSR